MLDRKSQFRFLTRGTRPDVDVLESDLAGLRRLLLDDREIQMVSIAVLLTVFLTYPLISASITPLAERGSKVMEYFPFFWFL